MISQNLLMKEYPSISGHFTSCVSKTVFVCLYVLDVFSTFSLDFCLQLADFWNNMCMWTEHLSERWQLERAGRNWQDGIKRLPISFLDVDAILRSKWCFATNSMPSLTKLWVHHGDIKTITLESFWACTFTKCIAVEPVFPSRDEVATI